MPRSNVELWRTNSLSTTRLVSGSGCQLNDGAIALDRAGGGFVVGGDADGVEFQRLWFFGEDRIPRQTKGQACQGSSFTRRHDIVPIAILKQYNMTNENVCF